MVRTSWWLEFEVEVFFQKTSTSKTLLLYALCHQFLQVIIEGDELYTKVGENKPPSESEGWTIVLMDRASRFIWELSCGEKETDLFENAMATLVQVIEETDDLSLVTDGERRYGNLFEDKVFLPKKLYPRFRFRLCLACRYKIYLNRRFVYRSC